MFSIIDWVVMYRLKANIGTNTKGVQTFMCGGDEGTESIFPHGPPSN